MVFLRRASTNVFPSFDPKTLKKSAWRSCKEHLLTFFLLKIQDYTRFKEDSVMFLRSASTSTFFLFIFINPYVYNKNVYFCMNHLVNLKRFIIQFTLYFHIC